MRSANALESLLFLRSLAHTDVSVEGTAKESTVPLAISLKAPTTMNSLAATRGFPNIGLTIFSQQTGSSTIQRQCNVSSLVTYTSSPVPPNVTRFPIPYQILSPGNGDSITGSRSNGEKNRVLGGRSAGLAVSQHNGSEFVCCSGHLLPSRGV